MARGVQVLRISAVAVVASGCTLSAPIAGEPVAAQPTEYQAPSSAQYVDRWLPTPAVDLMSADGTFIRAFVEASTVAFFNRDKDAGSYPGYVRANRTLAASSDQNTTFHTRWIVSIQSLPNNWVIATLCTYGSMTTTGPHPRGFRTKMKYHRVGTTPPTQQQGTAAVPRFSVFGDWYATYFSYGSSVIYPDPQLDVDPFLPCPIPRGPASESPVPTPGWPQTPLY